MKNISIIKHKVSATLRSCIIILAVCFIEQACAQPVQNIRIKGGAGIMPVMKITNLGRNEANPMKIDELKIDIKVLGQIAVTTMEFSYFNANDRIMEGEFSFPLAEGQTVTRFALDINGQMREGVVVEKEQGRKTFEAIARRQVDPGLLEMTQGNNFRARVYPLPAKGYRKIIIAYEQELTDKNKGYMYQLPLKINTEIRSFSIHAEIIRQQVKFDIEENEFPNIGFEKWNDSYITDIKKENYLPDKQLAFMIPYMEANATSYTEPFKENSDSSWFYLNFKPKQVNKEKVLPKKITLLWDNSNSGTSRDTTKDMQVLDGYIQKIGNLQIELVPFNIKTEKSRLFNITNGNWNDLRKVLSGMVYDGGTSFGNIDFTKFICDEILLFSDGLSNFGSSTPTLSKVPLMVINSSVIANHSFLNYIAQRSNGMYLNLSKLNETEAISALSKSDYHFISATTTQGNISRVFPSIPSQFQNSFSMAGVLKGKSASITLNFGFGNTIVYSENIALTSEKASNTGMLKRVWAQKKLTELNVDEETNKDEITRLGKEYGIVTSNTSLIVLESLNDYLQHHIVPPKELQADYFAKIKEEQQGNDEMIKNHIDYVAGIFDDRVNWWNTAFPRLEIHHMGYASPVVVDTVREENLSEPSFESAPAEIIVEESDAPQLNYSFNARSEQIPANIQVSKEEISETEKNENGTIQLNAWDPQTPYLKVLQYSAKGEEYATYLKLKDEYGSLPFFYVDASDFFSNAGQKDIALKILSNLAELKLEEPQLLRILGKKLQMLNEYEEAVSIFKKVLKMRGEEPQSYRDLGLAYDANGQYQLAINTLYEVIKREWDSRFPQIELIVLEEINNIIAKHKTAIKYSFMDGRLAKNLPLDIRAVLTWDTNDCDMDLWITDPAGEKCFYSNSNTKAGGLISSDFTQGYGPEEFLLKKAISGDYSIEVNYYGTRSQSALAPVTLHLSFYTNYGKPNEKKQETTLRLENKEDVIAVGKFRFSAPVK